MDYEKGFLYRNKSVLYFRKIVHLDELSLYVHKR